MNIIQHIFICYCVINCVLILAGAAEFDYEVKLSLTIGKILFPGVILGFYGMKICSIKIGNNK